MPTVSICLATYRRNGQLAELLDDLAQQTRLPDEVVIVDNDAAGGARTVVDNAQLPFPLCYEVQPVKNIALTRNRTVALASGEWLALIDDDERAPPQWLEQMLATALETGADAVLGHVRCLVPDDAPEWLRRGADELYSSWNNPHGKPFPLNRISKGNALMRASRVREQPGPFDPALGITGGSDSDLYGRLFRAGAVFVWCGTVGLTEMVEPSRLSARWLILRGLRGGQDYARNLRSGDFGPLRRFDQPRYFVRFAVQALVASGLAVLTRPLGRHRAMKWWVSAAANVGKLSAWWGFHYREYDTRSRA